MADEGKGILNLTPGMTKDLDSGKAKDRDITDFLPDSMAQELYDQSHPGPVHAENLIPITPAEGAKMRQITPGSLPKMPATRRVIPAPYKRDRVVGGSHGKAWTLVRGEQVREGDIITGVGLVTNVEVGVVYDDISRHHNHLVDVVVEGCPGCFPVATATEYTVTGAGGNVVTYVAGAEVKVFRGRSSQ